MPHLAFCANCGSERLDLIGAGPDGLRVRCYTCTKQSVVQGVILGEIDFLAGAKTRVDAMVAKAREQAALKAERVREVRQVDVSQRRKPEFVGR